MQEEHCCSVNLIVVGDDLEPKVVTSALGWPPAKSWRRGERKRFKRPDGIERVFDSIYDCGDGRVLPAHDERELPLEVQVSAWLDRLRFKSHALRSLSDCGWEIKLDCFAATSECINLSSTILGELAGLGVGLTLTFSAL